MKSHTISIQIPDPCNENWDKMQSDNQGRFCGSCQKTVIDFTGKSDVEIRKLLLARAGEKVCGHLKTTQVNRPLQLTIDLTTLPRNVLPARAFAIALLLTFGTSLISCYDHRGAKINKIEMSTTSKNKSIGTTKGEVLLYETEDSLSVKKAPAGAESIENEGIRGDVVIMQEEIMGKMAFHEEPIDSLVNGEIKTCNSRDTTLEGPVIRDQHIMGGMVMMVSQEEQNKNDSAISSEELKTTLESPLTPPENIFRIYPNPSSGEFNIQYSLLKPSDVQVHIFNTDGKLIESPVNINAQHSGQYQIPLALKEQPAGVYIIMLIENGKKSTQRVIVAK